MILFTDRILVSHTGSATDLRSPARWPLLFASVFMMLAMLVSPAAASDKPVLEVAQATVIDGMKAVRDGRFQDAITIWGPHAERGNPLANYGLGLIYAKQRAPDMPARPVLAHHHYKAAAKKGHVGAVFELAFQYERGVGTEENIEHALGLYRVAAVKNHLNAQYNLAVLLSQGGKVKTQLREAFFCAVAAQHIASIRPQGELTFEKVTQLVRTIRVKLPHQIASKTGRAATKLTGQPV